MIIIFLVGEAGVHGLKKLRTLQHSSGSQTFTFHGLHSDSVQMEQMICILSELQTCKGPFRPPPPKEHRESLKSTLRTTALT